MDENDCLEFVHLVLHCFVPFGIIGPSLLSDRFDRKGDAEFVANDIRGDAKHVIVGPSKNFRVGLQKGDEFGPKSQAEGSANPNCPVLCRRWLSFLTPR
ncbi:unnamed protein product [Prunus armeniaca]